MFHKWAYFRKKAKGLTLLFAPKIDVSQMGLFSQKAKGLTLLFAPKIDVSPMGLFLAKKQRG